MRGPPPHHPSSPTPQLALARPLLSTPANDPSPQRRLVRGSSGGISVPAGLAGWRRGPKAKSGSSSSGPGGSKKRSGGLGYGKEGTPAKRIKRGSSSKSIGVQSTPKGSRSHSHSHPHHPQHLDSSSLSSLPSSLPDPSAADLSPDPPSSAAREISSPDIPPITALPNRTVSHQDTTGTVSEVADVVVASDVFGDTTFIPGADIPLNALLDASQSFQQSITQREAEEMYEEMEHVWPEMFHDTVEPAHGWSEEDQEEDVPFEIDIDAMDEIEGVTTPQALAHLNSLFHLAGKQGSPWWSNITIDPALLTIRDEIVPLNPFESSTPTERDITGKTENSRLEITVDPAEITIRDVTVPLEASLPKSAGTGSSSRLATPRTVSTGSKIKGRVSTPYRGPRISKPEASLDPEPDREDATDHTFSNDKSLNLEGEEYDVESTRADDAASRERSDSPDKGPLTKSYSPIGDLSTRTKQSSPRQTNERNEFVEDSYAEVGGILALSSPARAVDLPSFSPQLDDAYFLPDLLSDTPKTPRSSPPRAYTGGKVIEDELISAGISGSGDLTPELVFHAPDIVPERFVPSSQMATPTPTSAQTFSPISFAPTTRSPSATPVPSMFKPLTSLDPGPAAARGVEGRSRKKGAIDWKGAWRGAEVLKRMEAGDAERAMFLIGGTGEVTTEVEDEHDNADEDDDQEGVRGATRRRGVDEVEESLERLDLAEVVAARVKRIEHYRDLKLNYALHVELVLF